MKIHILFEFKEGPWGGGNQFLKALRQHFIQRNVYAHQAKDADVILFNSHHFLSQVIWLKIRYPKKLFIHRVAGPIFLARGYDFEVDQIIFRFNEAVADGTIYQSEWSKKENLRLGMSCNQFETTILNAPDSKIFFPKDSSGTLSKIRLIATSWSANPRKGFDIYHYLDNHLDFKRYSITFVGQADTMFNNINVIPPVPSERLADFLRNHDIFISASHMEACSNALLEGMHCGLPAVARNNTSYPEILKKGGLLFEGAKDVLLAIDKVADNLEQYQRNISLPTMEEVGDAYYQFAEHIFQAKQRGNYKVKPFSKAILMQLMMQIFWREYGQKIKRRLVNYISKIN